MAKTRLDHAPVPASPPWLSTTSKGVATGYVLQAGHRERVRRVVSIRELVSLNLDLAAHLGDVPDGVQVQVRVEE